MAEKRIPESSENINNENINEEVDIHSGEAHSGEAQIYSEHSTFCGLVPVISEKGIFDVIHENAHIPQKTVFYRPTDKLVFAILGIMSGSETIYDINYNLRMVTDTLC